MGFFSRKDRKERNEKIGTLMEKSSNDFFYFIFQKIGLKRYSDRVLEWSNNNKRKVFYITISFLSLIVIFSFYNAWKRHNLEDLQHFDEVNTLIHRKYEESTSPYQKYREVMKVIEKKSEIEEIMKKKSYTKEDSLKINNMYNQIFKDEKIN